MGMYKRPSVDRDSAHAYNEAHGQCIPFDDNIVEQTIEFQKNAEITVDGKWGPQTLAHWRQEHFQTGTIDTHKIVRLISDFEGNFDSLNRDGEYRGKFGTDHPAYQTRHLGLSFGFLQFNQDAGSLGELLKRMHEKDPDAFQDIFEYPDPLLSVTNRPKGQVENGRSQRVQPVCGVDLWKEPWVSRFREAGRVFQDAQIEYALDEYMAPARDTADALGLDTERSLAIVFDRSIQHGPSGGRSLLESVHDEQPEHLFLYECLKAWRDRPWGHRIETLYFHPQLTGGVEEMV